MFMNGLDMVGATVQMLEQVRAFEARHWAAVPWLQDVSGKTQLRRTDRATGAFRAKSLWHDSNNRRKT